MLQGQLKLPCSIGGLAWAVDSQCALLYEHSLEVPSRVTLMWCHLKTNVLRFIWPLGSMVNPRRGAHVD